MKKSISLFISLTKNWLRSKSGVFFSILFPVMLLIIFSAVFGGGETAEYTIHIENEDFEENGIPTELSEAFIKALDDTGTLNVNEVDNLTEHREEEEGFGSYRGLRIKEGFQERAENKSMSIRVGVMHETMLLMENESDMEEEEREEFERGKESLEEWSQFLGKEHLFDLNRSEYADYLNEGEIHEEMRSAFEEKNFSISDDAEMKYEENGSWTIEDEEKKFIIQEDEEENKLHIFREKESAKIVVYTSPGDQGGQVVQGTVRGVVDSFDSRMIGVEDTTIEVGEETTEDEELQPADYYLPGILTAFIMTNGIIAVTTTTTEYKRNGVLKRLSAAPIQKKDWILANVGQQTLLAFILTGVMILLSRILFDVQAVPGIYSLGLIFLGAVAFCSVGMVLGGFIKDVEAASGIGNAIAFPMMFLSGAFVPIEQFPGYLRTVARALPLYYFHQGLQELMILENLSGAIIPYIVLGSLTVVFLIAAIKVTDWKDM